MNSLTPFLYRWMVALSSAFFFTTVSAAVGLNLIDIYAFHLERLEEIIFYQRGIAIYNFGAALAFFVVDTLYRWLPTRSIKWFFNTLILSIIGTVFICTVAYFYVDLKDVSLTLFVIFLVFTNAFAIVEISKELLGVTDVKIHEKCIDGDSSHCANETKEYVMQQLEEELKNKIVGKTSYPSSEPTTLLTHSSSPFKNGSVVGEIWEKSGSKHSDKESE